MASSFRNLVAYQRAFELAHDIARATALWPKFERWSVGMQLNTAADSIAANIAEGDGRWLPNDRRHFFRVARGSLYETEHWLLVAKARGLIEEDFAAQLDAVARPLNGLISAPAPRR